MDGNGGTFWVSSGATQGQGPTVSNPEWLRFTFPRNAAVSDFLMPYGFDPGYWPTPMTFDCVNTLLVGINPGNPTKVTAVQVP